jgi:hypothetical protein
MYIREAKWSWLCDKREEEQVAVKFCCIVSRILLLTSDGILQDKGMVAIIFLWIFRNVVIKFVQKNIKNMMKNKNIRITIIMMIIKMMKKKVLSGSL